MQDNNGDLNWRWFMAVDYQGQWITVNGAAHLDIGSDQISGYMCLKDRRETDTDIYAEISADISDDGAIEMTVLSLEVGVPPFKVSGDFYTNDEGQSSAYTLILTDGTTVVGFTRHCAK